MWVIVSEATIPEKQTFAASRKAYKAYLTIDADMFLKYTYIYVGIDLCTPVYRCTEVYY